MATARLGDVLLRMGVITAAQLEQAMALQQRHKVRLGSILVDHGFVSEQAVIDALAQVSGLPRLDMLNVTVDPAASRWITKEWAEQHMTIPLAVDRLARALTVAICDPTDVAPIDELAFRTGLKVTPILGSDREIMLLHRHIFHGTPLARGRKNVLRPGAVEVDDLIEEPELLYGMDAVRDHLQHEAPPPTSLGRTSLGRTSLGRTSLAAPPPPAPAVSDVDQLLIPRLRVLLDAQQEAARELQILFELCVSRGIIQRQDYLERLQREDS